MKEWAAPGLVPRPSAPKPWLLRGGLASLPVRQWAFRRASGMDRASRIVVVAMIGTTILAMLLWRLATHLWPLVTDHVY